MVDISNFPKVHLPVSTVTMIRGFSRDQFAVSVRLDPWPHFRELYFNNYPTANDTVPAY